MLELCLFGFRHLARASKRDAHHGAQATAFIFALKQVLRDMFDKQLQDAGMARQFFEFEARIDRVCLAAFEIYVGCREQVFELKANEMRNRTFRAFKRAGLVAEPGGEEPQA